MKKIIVNLFCKHDKFCASLTSSVHLGLGFKCIYILIINKCITSFSDKSKTFLILKIRRFLLKYGLKINLTCALQKISDSKFCTVRAFYKLLTTTVRITQQIYTHVYK